MLAGALLISSLSLADELIIPLSCWPHEIKAAFDGIGRKLDLRGEDRTFNSWGLLVNEGSSYKIFTYEPIGQDEFQMIQEIVFKVWKDTESHE